MENGLNRQMENLVKTTLEAGRVVLVVGVKPGERLGWPYSNDDRFVFWQSDRKMRRFNPPRRTGVVLVTRFLDHGAARRIEQQVPKDAVIYTKHMNSGELKYLLDRARVPPATRKPEPVSVVEVRNSTQVPVASKPQVITATKPESETYFTEVPVPEASAQLAPVKKHGAVAAFVREHADLSAVSSSAEIKRLVVAALEAGIVATHAGVSSIFYLLKSGMSAQTTPARQESRSRAKHAVNVDSSELLKQFIELAEPAIMAAKALLEENRTLRDELAKSKKQLAAVKQAVSRLK